MTAVNKVRYVGNVNGAPGPYKFPCKFKAGATQAVQRGEILELSSGDFIPLDADQSMSAIIAVSDCEIISGDLAGYHDAIVPRPGDIFEAELATAAAPSPGASLYWSDSQTLTTTGSNVIGTVVDASALPLQGFQSRDKSYDAGTTIITKGSVRFMFKAAVSYFAALQT